ncbi:MAG: hypothetical protein O2860_08100 [Chloroflexi bacterium]|nr:hypothetical protein [Chloroflexota bacterium]
MSVSAVMVGLILALTVSIDGDSNQGSESLSPSITLGLTAEARQSLQQNGNAFPSNDAGFSAYYRMPDGSGGFGLDKAAADQVLFNDPTPTQRRAGIGTLIDISNSHSVGSVPIRNIDGLVTAVNLYYDEQGWLVAYFPIGDEPSRAWQARSLNVEDPKLTDVSNSTLLDAINDVLVEAFNSPPITPDQLGYYHWGHPTAAEFLMIATARGDMGIDTVSFAVPTSFTVEEVSVSMWIAETNSPCARTLLDGFNIMGDWCDRNFQHVFANLGDFNARSVHNLKLDHYNQDKGASGAMVMLVYSTN